MAYTYATIFPIKAEKAYRWLEDNAKVITPYPYIANGIKNIYGEYKDTYILIHYEATPEEYKAFADYMGFIYEEETR